MNRIRLYAIFRKEGLHIVRDPRSLIAALAVPLVMLLMFGWALSLDVDRVPTTVWDRDKSPQSRELIEHFRGSRYFEIREPSDSYRPIERDIDRSKIMLGVVIPDDFSKHILERKQADVQLLLDGSDSNTAGLARAYAEGVVQSYALEVRDRVAQQKGMGQLKPPVEPLVRVLYNNDLKSRNYIVPGLIAVILMIISALLTSLTIAREWESGTMEQLLSTPVRPIELLLGKLGAFFALGLVDTLIAIVVGVYIFGVPLHGNPLLLVATSCLFLFGALCWGIFISTVTRSQLIAFQMSMITSFLPAFLLSGFVYSIENMPTVIQVVTYVIPARYFVTILKGIFLKGVGVEILWLELALLVVYAVVLLAVATRKLREKVV